MATKKKKKKVSVTKSQKKRLLVTITPRVSALGDIFYKDLLLTIGEGCEDQTCRVYRLSAPIDGCEIALSRFGEPPHMARKYSKVYSAIKGAKTIYKQAIKKRKASLWRKNNSI